MSIDAQIICDRHAGGTLQWLVDEIVLAVRMGDLDRAKRLDVRMREIESAQDRAGRRVSPR